MQPRANFHLVKTDDPGLFVVKISGHLGTRQRPAVDALVRKCRETGKKKVAFDFSELESLGGSVAKILGDFARELSTVGHPPWFIGATPVVQSFLTARFDSATPCFADDLHTARVALAAEPVLARSAGSAPAPVDDRDPVLPDEDIPDGSASLDASELLGSDDEEEAIAIAPAERVEDEAAVEATDQADESAEVEGDDGDVDAAPEALQVELRSGPHAPVPPVGAESGVIRRHSYLTLADAEPLLVEIADLRDAKPVIDGLLYGADLAETCELFCVEGDRLVQVVLGAQPTPRSLPANGSVVTVLRRRAAPVDIVDLTEMTLTDEESDLLTDLQCPVVVPVFVEGELAGIFFVRKGQAGEDYVPSEELALDLLARQIGHSIGQGRQRTGATRSDQEKQLRAQVRRQRSVLRLSRELHALGDADQLVSRLLISLIGEMGVSGAVFLEVRKDELLARHVYGIENVEIKTLPVATPQEIRALGAPVALDHADRAVWGPAIEGLQKLGIDLLAPLRGNETFYGVLALATKRARNAGNFDSDFLQAIVSQAGVAADHVRAVHELEEQMLRVAKTLIALIERRIGQGHMASTEMVTHYTARVADVLNYDRDHRRDLLYGAVLRDVGMIEISDLVLKSPRSLSPEEWRLVKRHPISGVELLRAMRFSDVTCDVVLHHHERFNGEGYPHGLRGTAIPLGARIVSVVESYVAMIHDTPYRPALSPEEALGVLEENWEMRYDTTVVEAFARIVRREPRPERPDSVDSLLSS